jgi:ribosomal protein L20A (L18A)
VRKSFFKTKAIYQQRNNLSPEGGTKMSEKMDKQHIKELKKMVQEKKPKEPVEKVLVKFCARHGVSLDACRVHYNRLVENGEIEEK